MTPPDASKSSPTLQEEAKQLLAALSAPPLAETGVNANYAGVHDVGAGRVGDSGDAGVHELCPACHADIPLHDATDDHTVCTRGHIWGTYVVFFVSSLVGAPSSFLGSRARGLLLSALRALSSFGNRRSLYTCTLWRVLRTHEPLLPTMTCTQFVADLFLTRHALVPPPTIPRSIFLRADVRPAPQHAVV